MRGIFGDVALPLFWVSLGLAPIGGSLVLIGWVRAWHGAAARAG
jgi:hypothetical protein